MSMVPNVVLQYRSGQDTSTEDHHRIIAHYHIVMAAVFTVVNSVEILV